MTERRDLVLAVSPLGRPNARVAAAATRAGAVGVLDLGNDRAAALAALDDAVRWSRGSFGVRVAEGCPLRPSDLPGAVDLVVLAAGSGWEPADAGNGRRVLVEISDPDEAPLPGSPQQKDIDGVVARGSEAGGRAGELSTFVLLQRLLGGPGPHLPVWAAGGIGIHTAAAAITGGATGVVLDCQLLLSTESIEQLSPAEAAAIRAMDGGETEIEDGRRLLRRPPLTAPLAVGQDGAFAAPLAARYRTVGGIVQAVRAGIADHIRSAAGTAALSEGAGIAGNGLRLPVVQGPMTRVSDRTAFATAVAAEGGLPFLALALTQGPEVERLLAEAAAALADQPWGVGILGFVPPELREAQVEAIRAIRPPYALIAGGRPDQAAALESEGIATFLHVPSPGLLDRFLAEGARRFVFEGSECGGHIGPRASFPLWEAQVERLLAHGEAVERTGQAAYFQSLQLLFAGGIHDERSAAMVAAVAAPLTERGAGIGVLMGTAYLFTAEAVAAGAILPGFQAAALSCTHTSLLETSPGHVTRCADTPYVAAFAEARRRLTAGGTPPKEMWEELERLNLGRLRIASKGLRRDGNRLVAIAADEQATDGMYMLGQAATLRSEATTIGRLHGQVTAGAMDLLRRRSEELGLGPTDEHPTPEPGPPLDVAIVGMACVLPGADGLASFWANVVAARDAVTEVPPERWDAARYYRSDAYRNGGGTTASKWGGFIPPVPFDALAYGIPPASLAAIEPVQLLALEVAARAIADAGYSTRNFDRARASVVFGADGGHDLASAYTFRALAPSYLGDRADELAEHLPAMSEDSFPGVLANVIAGRIANRLDLGGVNYTVDAACASSLAALDVACKELQTGGSDLVLCGGADLHNGIYDYLMFTAARALSPTGRCRTFDATADGIALGEGVVCLALKRLADAERDGDRIYAVVKGVGGSSDGKSLGLTAPRPDGQRLALDRAYRAAGVPPAVVGLIEAHGTGTVVGDHTELGVLTQLFAESGAAPATCALGSVKTQIGHTKCAAGLAGLVKVARALHAGVRPPTGPITTPNPSWDAETSPFFFDQQARPWAAAPGDRFAGVSAFGFGGTNFHVVLQGYDGAPEPMHGVEEWPAELFCFRGEDPGAAVAAMRRLAERLEANDAAGRPLRLRDLAAETAAAAGPVQVTLVAASLDELAGMLPKAMALRTDAGAGIFARSGDIPAQRSVAFLFPGQGSQRPGMLADLFVAFPRLAHHLRGDAAAYVATMFPPAAFTPEAKEAQRAAITDTRVAQPVMGIADAAMAELLGWLGVRPAMAGGHSYGELVALAAAGALAPGDLVKLGQARAQAILGAAGDDPGTMAAVKAGPDAVREVLHSVEGNVVIANYNSPDQVVISGPSPAVARAVSALEERGLTARPIPVACAFHSPVVAAAAGAFAEVLDGCEVSAPAYPVWSNTTAEPYPNEAPAIRSCLAGQVANPVCFADEIESMYEAGARVFVECGPGRVLSGLVNAILGDRPHVACATDVGGEPGLRRLLLALAELAAAGVDVDPSPLFTGRVAPVPARLLARPGWTVDGHMVRTTSGEVVPGGLKPAAVVTGGAWHPVPAVPTAAETNREAAVLEFLKASREAIAAQREVMLGYLGRRAPGDLPAPAAAPQPVASPAAPAPATAAQPKEEPFTEARLRSTILAIVSQRTGYPEEMLTGDLDLEADLSIDSIKRTEIIMELAQTLRLTGPGTAGSGGVVEQLARLKTIEAIVGWLRRHLESLATGPAPASAATAESSASQRKPSVDLTAPPTLAVPAALLLPLPQRYLIEVTSRAHDHTEISLNLAGLRFVVVDDGEGIGAATAASLRRRGADALLLDVHHDLEASCSAADGVVYLGALRPGLAPVLPEAFAALRAAILGGARMLLVATGSGGLFGQGWDGSESTDPTPGLGLRGFVRTIARECPHLLARAVDIDPRDQPHRIAELLVSELAADASGSSPSPVVGYSGGTRSALNVVEAALAAPASASLDEAVRAAATELGLGPESVVVLSGGGRGITATCAIALGRACGCRIEILGRTPSPERSEHPDIAAAHDRPSLRRALLGQGVATPAEVEAAMSRILASRQLQATLERLAAASSSVRYHPVDVCDAAAVRHVIEDIHDRWGRIDGVIHGAGVLEDRLLADKTPESFSRVFRTKVDGARALAAALAPLEKSRPPVRFFALFGSVSGVFGNPGQVDYSAANDALDTLARMWAQPGVHQLAHRVVSVDWGPWASAGGGMVSPELEREYARRGIGMIAPEHGVAALFNELAFGELTNCQVVYTGGASTDAFGGAARG